VIDRCRQLRGRQRGTFSCFSGIGPAYEDKVPVSPFHLHTADVAPQVVDHVGDADRPLVEHHLARPLMPGGIGAAEQRIPRLLSGSEHTAERMATNRSTEPRQAPTRPNPQQVTPGPRPNRATPSGSQPQNLRPQVQPVRATPPRAFWGISAPLHAPPQPITPPVSAGSTLTPSALFATTT
jgi:hypothetical protein